MFGKEGPPWKREVAYDDGGDIEYEENIAGGSRVELRRNNPGGACRQEGDVGRVHFASGLGNGYGVAADAGISF